MSLVGSTSRSVQDVLVEARGYGVPLIERIVATGMLPAAHSGQVVERLEVDLGAEPGAIEMGPHILAVLRV
jgi:hypothetical protein